MLKKKGQIWIETVIYTLVGLAMIGLVLAIIMPKINQTKDKAVIDQTVDALRLMDSKIAEVVQEGPGNVRNVNFGIKRGSLSFNLTGNEITYEMDDSRVIYSEPGLETSIGKIKVLTIEGNKFNKIFLKLKYDEDLVFNDGSDEISNGIKTFTAAATPYKFSFSHLGFTEDSNVEKIEIKENN